MRTWLVPLFMAFFRGLISTQMLQEDKSWWEGVELDQGYGLKAPLHQVLVEKGLCATIPCTFIYNKEHDEKNKKLKGFWKKGTNNENSEELTRSAQDRFQLIGNLTEGNCSLLIWKPETSDIGNYFFRMEKGSKAKYSFNDFANPHLNVIERQSPEIQILDTMRAGSSTNITCATFASCRWMPPNVTWNGFPKPIDPHLQLNETQVYRSVVNFTPSAADHKRNITCRVNYINGSDPHPRETTVQLNVIFKPIIVIKVERICSNKSQGNFTRLSQLSVRKGDCIRLRCKVKGNPSPNVTWVKETKDLKASNVLILKLSDIKLEDAGKYTCSAVNEIDSGEESFELYVKDPNTILFLAVTGALVTLAVIILIIGIFLASKRYRRKSKRATESETRSTVMNVKKPNILDLAAQEVNGVPSKPRSTHEPVDGGDPRDPEEIHYATLTFNAPNPNLDVTAEDVQTDYAEIRPCSSQGEKA